MSNKILMLPAFAFALAAAACSERNDVEAANKGMNQTKFPGMVTSGGTTSGEELARAKASVADVNPSGTPGIPEGSGGNTSGAAMGGTTGGSAVSGASNAGGTSAGGGTPAAGAAPAAGGAPAGGTPGIPEGSGGNASGAAMGGTTGGAATNQAEQGGPQGQTGPASPAAGQSSVPPAAPGTGR